MILRGFVYLVLACFHVSQVQAEPPRGQTVEQKYPGLATHILASARLTPMEKGVLLKSDGIEVRESILKKGIEKAEPAVRPQLEKHLFFLLEQETMKRLLVREARNVSISTDGLIDEQAIQAYLNQVVQGAKVSDGEAKAFYEENKEIVGGMPFEKVREGIREILLQKKRRNLTDSHIKELIQKAHIRINESWVKAQYSLAMDNPVDRARMSGKPTMVEFGAKGCIPCDMMQPILDNLRKKYPDKLNVVFVHVGEKQVLGARFGIRVIPVQVFFDKNGEEVFRHEGFYPEAEVTKQLLKLGVT